MQSSPHFQASNRSSLAPTRSSGFAGSAQRRLASTAPLELTTSCNEQSTQSPQSAPLHSLSQTLTAHTTVSHSLAALDSGCQLGSRAGKPITPSTGPRGRALQRASAWSALHHQLRRKSYSSPSSSLRLSPLSRGESGESDPRRSLSFRWRLLRFSSPSDSSSCRLPKPATAHAHADPQQPSGGGMGRSRLHWLTLVAMLFCGCASLPWLTGSSNTTLRRCHLWHLQEAYAQVQDLLATASTHRCLHLRMAAQSRLS